MGATHIILLPSVIVPDFGQPFRHHLKLHSVPVVIIGPRPLLTQQFATWDRVLPGLPALQAGVFREVALVGPVPDRLLGRRGARHGFEDRQGGAFLVAVAETAAPEALSVEEVLGLDDQLLLDRLQFGVSVDLDSPDVVQEVLDDWMCIHVIIIIIDDSGLKLL